MAQITFLRVSLDMRVDIRIQNASRIALERKEKFQIGLVLIHALIISAFEVKCHGLCHHGSGLTLPRFEFWVKSKVNVLGSKSTTYGSETWRSKRLKVSGLREWDIPQSKSGRAKGTKLNSAKLKG